MPLNYIKRLHRRNNNVKNKNAGGDLILAIVITEQFSQCLQVSQLTTTSINIDYWHASHLIFASCYVRDTYCSRHFNFAIFLESRNSRNLSVAKISCNKIVSKHDVIDVFSISLIEWNPCSSTNFYFKMLFRYFCCSEIAWNGLQILTSTGNKHIFGACFLIKRSILDFWGQLSSNFFHQKQLFLFLEQLLSSFFFKFRATF